MLRTRQRLLIIALALSAAVVLACGVYLATVALRPRIAIANVSGETVSHVACSLEADGVTWTESIEELAPGGAVRFSRSTSDFFVHAVAFSYRGEKREWRDGAIATIGETVVLRIDEQGDILVSYER